MLSVNLFITVARMIISLTATIPYHSYYRAPELIFGSTDYTTAIDVWSQGCVMAELLLGQPVFPGSSGVDQLVEIIKVSTLIFPPIFQKFFYSYVFYNTINRSLELLLAKS